MLATVLSAELLIFSAFVLATPPLPPLVPFSQLLDLLEGRDPGLAGLKIDVAVTATPPPREGSGAAAALARAVERDLALASGEVRVSFSGLGPPSPFGPQPVESIMRGARPTFLAGDFVVGRRLADGRWRTVRSEPGFLRDVSVRIGLMLLGTLGVVLPAAYALARHSTRPIRRFAEAAERLGRDPRAAPLAEEGPEEIRVASEAFNRMQRRLNSYIEERTTMVAAVAHDLRTPLMRMAFEIEDAPESLQKALSAQIREMRDMTDALMRFLRAEQSRHDRELINLDALLGEVVEGFVRNGKPVSLVLLEPGLDVVGDPVGLKSVFRNVIGNALAYGQEADVKAAALDDHVVVTVSDKGPGLADDDLQRVFQPFYRVEKSRNRSTGGVGLGLAVARSIVVAHGGEITLENLAQGGLRARVRLPLAGHARGSPRTAAVPSDRREDEPA
jgi:signal transduction histidine kinase